MEEIQKKFLSVKTKCLEIHHKKCEDSVQTEIEKLESDIRQENLTTLQDLYNRIDTLKSAYQGKTGGITYKLKEVVIKSISEKLLLKGFEVLMRRDKEQLSNQNRQLTEKVSYLEKDLASKRKDYENERDANIDRLASL